MAEKIKHFHEKCIQKMHFHKELQGSFIVEASIIVPLIFFLVCHVLFFMIYSYHQSLIFQGNYCTALYTERCYEEDSEKSLIAEEKYEDAIKSRLVWGRAEKELEVNKYVSVKSVFEMESPALALFWGKWKLDYKQTVSKWEPVEFIRNCRKAEDIMKFLQEKNKE